MDLDEWELLSSDGFDDDGDRKLYPVKRNSDPKSLFNMDYFICPSQIPLGINVPCLSPRKIRVLGDELVQIPILTEPEETVADIPLHTTISPSEKKIQVQESDQEAVTQVFFKKMNENEFVDMKMDSPRSCSSKGSVIPQIDAGCFDFDEKSEIGSIDSPMKTAEEKDVCDWEENHGGLKMNLWKLSLSGIGAICSFGVAAATICIIVLGSNQKNKQQEQQFRFQFYTGDNKRIKQVVEQASKLNEAISAARGVPMSRAHITCGGYYNSI